LKCQKHYDNIGLIVISVVMLDVTQFVTSITVRYRPLHAPLHHAS